MTINLNSGEVQTLMKQPASEAAKGGFQGLFVRLQKNLDTNSGALELSDSDLERIPKYAKYGNGGWEDRFFRIFGRTLGPNLNGK